MTLSTLDFAFVSGLIRREASIVLGPGKEYLVEARLLPLARQAGLASVGEFIAKVQRGGDPTSTRSIVNALTTNETSWFRDREPFSALVDRILPEIVNRRPAVRKLRCWSAACSSGQEPYSLALTLEQALPADWTYEIVATDIDSDMIARAEAGEFSQVEINRGLPVSLLVKHFERAGAHWRISSALRRKVSFQRLNLTAPLPSLGSFDLILLRNILIYFDVQTKRTVLGNVGRLLAPDGWLLLGAAETTIGIDDRYERVAAGRTSAYRLRTAVPAGIAGSGVS